MNLQYRIKLLIATILLGSIQLNSQSLDEVKSQFPDGTLHSLQMRGDTCFYYLSTTNNNEQSLSDRIHTVLIVDINCDFSVDRIHTLRDINDNDFFVATDFFMADNYFYEIYNETTIPEIEISVNLNVYDHRLNLITHEKVITDSWIFSSFLANKSGTNEVLGYLDSQVNPSYLVFRHIKNSAIVTTKLIPQEFALYATSLHQINEGIDTTYLMTVTTGIATLNSNLQFDTFVNSDLMYNVHGDIEVFNDQILLFGGWYPEFLEPLQVTFNVYNKDLELLQFDTFGDLETIDYPFIQNSLEITKDAIYTAAMNEVPFDIHSTSQSIPFVISKYDYDYNLIWRKSYGGDAAYVMFGIASTPDDRILTYGAKRDTTTGMRYPFVMSIDDNGIVTSTKDNISSKENYSFTIYGNPMRDALRLHASFPLSHEYSIHLFNASGQSLGKHILQQEMNTFDISYLPAGPIFYRILEDNTRRVDNGKLVKVR